MKEIKKYWNKRPCNIRYSKKKIGTEEYFNEVEKKRYFVEPHIIDFANFLKWKNKKVLEIGCGIGTDTINFARNNSKVTAIDISEKSLKICKKRFNCFNLFAKFYCGNAEKLSEIIPQEKFDLVYSFGVIHHTNNPKNILNQIKKFCKKDTEIRVMLYSKISWKVLRIFLKYGKMKFWKINELIKKYSEAQFGCPVTYVYTFKKIKKLFKDFEITKIYKKHMFPYKINKYINNEYEKIWLFKFMPKFIFNFLQKIFGEHILIIAKIKEKK